MVYDSKRDKMKTKQINLELQRRETEIINLVKQGADIRLNIILLLREYILKRREANFLVTTRLLVNKFNNVIQRELVFYRLTMRFTELCTEDTKEYILHCMQENKVSKKLGLTLSKLLILIFKSENSEHFMKLIKDVHSKKITVRDCKLIECKSQSKESISLEVACITRSIRFMEPHFKLEPEELSFQQRGTLVANLKDHIAETLSFWNKMRAFNGIEGLTIKQFKGYYVKEEEKE